MYDDDWEDDPYDEWDHDDDDDDQSVDCPYCNESIYDDVEQCPHCNMYLSASSFERPKPVWTVIIIVVLIISMLLFYL